MMRDSSRCCGARELGSRGAAAGHPQRQRGGSRRVLRGWRGKGRRYQREERKAVWSPGVTRGCHGELEVAGGRPERWVALRRAGGAETEKQRGKHEVEEGWTYLQFPKTPATSL